ncbi:MAG: hypothetical protein ACREVK_10385 [Gammaproteobacteria bacterium]
MRARISLGHDVAAEKRERKLSAKAKVEAEQRAVLATPKVICVTLLTPRA